ncbi:nitrate reductase cytochrome c-type subunit [Helicobacter kayseriensis]|uniref:nitrate reductase cytochrome c-type subunit n=1 Tax=Helicobacter kayseriensis TaxID=2905877 RepID=UPI001E5F5F9D|nr:nitrate reductase cytochrome c-type subunit [Helicobacter kayseriensis]MCE3047548.1 nitrate reductase cytochrome c-type subunit [Helicobacter kayseriensis]MCE3048870.1 nitrate reductase cytochrome c-type subunit [Helicobacter kayseriensis]
MKMMNLFVVGGLLVSFAFGAKSISEDEIGLRRTPLQSEDKTKLQDFKYGDKAPGESQVFERAYENAPPMIPHDVEGLTDFTQDSNMCLDCHSPEVAADVGATPVPKSHTYDLRHQQAVQDGVADSRWNCTQCHAPQADLKPAVQNNFKPIYRSKESKKSSNLLDVINEGVQ